MGLLKTLWNSFGKPADKQWKRGGKGTLYKWQTLPCKSLKEGVFIHDMVFSISCTTRYCGCLLTSSEGGRSLSHINSQAM